MKTIYLHIGIGKTGTSSIQDMLVRNYDLFLKQDVLVPKSGIKYGMAHHGLANLAEEDFSLETKENYEDLIKEIDESNAKTVIISSELFSYVKPRYIEQIHQYLNKYDVKIVFYVREQVKLFESGYLQNLKAGSEKLQKNNMGGVIYDFRQFCSDLNKKDFNLLIQPWHDMFGYKNIICKLYDKKLNNGDICSHFLKVIKLEKVAIEYPNKQSNESLIPDFIKLVEMIDKLNPNSDKRISLINKLILLSNRFRPLAKNHILDDSEFYKNLRNSFYESNDLFASKYLTQEEKEILLNYHKEDNL
ncbi:hypothetical protein DF188_05820 [Aliarcobacter skirrowii]|uniref:Sulfotransferase domain-containing protein n=1 Tax=Aliarcobacter skirrowii TaxID=28200 RepID=A0A2U2C128_9BACT|nr:hypothetical protein [Aliarcobacter skirrowii]PWE21730.1 hypothetical protein DF188_05820 [Aliarcobacter skirrowii]